MKTFVLVEALQTYRMRYVVEVSLADGKSIEQAEAIAVVCVESDQAQEFSQKDLPEQVISHRVISFDDAIALCDKDNQYAASWSTDKKVNAFITQKDLNAPVAQPDRARTF